MSDETKTKKELLDELSALKQKLNYVYQYDSLTHLPLRTAFYQKGSKLLKSLTHKKQAFLFINIDRMHMINSAIGHLAGDELLKVISIRLNNLVGEEHLVTRYGGDEFLVLLTNMDSVKEITQKVKEVSHTLSLPWHYHTFDVHITVSIGVSISQSQETMFSLQDRAYVALKRAKEHGRNRIEFYQNQMKTITAETLELDGALRRALDNDEFILHYQPQFDMSNNSIIGFEALIRWNHPELGLVPPLKFIPIAEDNGLIIPIGQWVLRTACTHIKKLQEEGYSSAKVAVNLSGLQFKQKDLVDVVKNILAETKLEAKYLELELTETVFIKDITDAVEKINALKKLGISIVIDDFGTGYSSLNYLKQLLIDTLKIDQSFVKDIANESNDTHISNAIITMAEKMNIDVIAEGVETLDQYNYLKSVKCQKMQGFYFSQPIAYDEIRHLLTNWDQSVTH